MTAQLLTEYFHLLAAAPNGVQKLRELILNLAVRGKLVPQNPSDEPASELLKRIRAEKARLIAEGKIKKEKPSPEIREDEMLFDLPDGWEWGRFLIFGRVTGGATPSTSKAEYWGGSIPWVSPKDMKTDWITSSELQITERALAETRLEVIPPSSVLIVARSGILKRTLPVSLNSVQCTVNQDLKVLIPYDNSVSVYLRIMLKGFESFILENLVKGGMTVQSLMYDEFFLQPFPVPPLAEQSE